MATATKLYTPNRRLGQKWSSLNSWQSYLEHFQQASVGNIQSNYQIARAYYYAQANSSRYQPLLKELELEKQESTALPDSISIVLGKIQSMGNLWRFVEKDSPMVVSSADAQSIVDGWQNIIRMAQTQNWEGISTSLTRLQMLSNSIQTQIDSGTETISISEIMKNPKGSSVALSIQGTLSLIRGAILEQEVKKFLQPLLPQTIEGQKSNIYVTGSITLNGISIKEDILNILDGLEIKNKNGQVLYYFQGGNIYEKDGVTKAKKVTLTEYEYEQLINNSGAGFSAKTSSGQTVFHGGYNIQTLLNDAGGFKDKAIAQLYHMYQLGVGQNETAYQNYAVSKIVTKVLGERNIFMVSRNEIVPTYHYIDKLLKYPLSFKNKKLPARGENAPLNTDFGTTDIVGPHI